MLSNQNSNHGKNDVSGHISDIPTELAEQLRNVSESFTPMLLRLIQERGMTEVDG